MGNETRKMNNNGSKFERLILGIYFKNDRLKELQKKSKDKGLKGDEVFEFIHLDRMELIDKTEQQSKTIAKLREALEEMQGHRHMEESFYQQLAETALFECFEDKEDKDEKKEYNEL